MMANMSDMHLRRTSELASSNLTEHNSSLTDTGLFVWLQLVGGDPDKDIAGTPCLQLDQPELYCWYICI